MPGLSLPSRIYSSSTLMDGEALVSEQQFDDWGEDELLQELAKLKAILNKNIFINPTNNFDFCF